MTSTFPRVQQVDLPHKIPITFQDRPTMCDAPLKRADSHQSLPTFTPKIPSQKSDLCAFKPTIFSYPKVNHIFNERTGKKETIDSLWASTNGAVWEQALSNEWGWLAQSNANGITYTDTIDFIPKNLVPKNLDVTYASFVCDNRPLKSEPWRVWIVVGGDRLSYDTDPGSPAASL